MSIEKLEQERSDVTAIRAEDLALLGQAQAARRPLQQHRARCCSSEATARVAAGAEMSRERAPRAKLPLSATATKVRRR